MKELILGLVGLVVVGCSNFKQETYKIPNIDFKVGDKMPVFDPNSYGTYDFGNWSKAGKTGTFIKWDKKDSPVGLWDEKFYVGDGKPDYLEVRIRCEGKIVKTPFGVGDYKKGLVYLDLDMDEFIDKIVKSKGRRVEDDAPDCPIGV